MDIPCDFQQNSFSEVVGILAKMGFLYGSGVVGKNDISCNIKRQFASELIHAIDLSLHIKLFHVISSNPLNLETGKIEFSM